MSPLVLLPQGSSWPSPLPTGQCHGSLGCEHPIGPVRGGGMAAGPLQLLPHRLLSCRAQNHLGKPQKVGVAASLPAAARPRAGGGEGSEFIRRSGLCSWGPKASWGPGCVWRAGTAALSPRDTRGWGEQDLPRRRPVPSCHRWSWVRAGVRRGQAAAARPLGPIFAGAGAPWHRNSLLPAARGGRARASGSWTEATCMPLALCHGMVASSACACPAPPRGSSERVGHLLILQQTLGTGVQPGVPGLDALRRGDLAGRARCPKLTCCPCLRARVRVAGEDEPGFSTYLPAALPGPGLPLACCLTCEPVSVCFVSLRTHSPALSPRNITSLPAPPSTKQLGPLGPARLRTHGPGW